jgi:hypothetical protein
MKRPPHTPSRTIKRRISDPPPSKTGLQGFGSILAFKGFIGVIRTFVSACRVKMFNWLRHFIDYRSKSMEPTSINAISSPSQIGVHLNQNKADAGTLDHLIAKYKIKSMVSIANGQDDMVQLARQRGLLAHEINGDPFINADAHHDYSKCAMTLQKTTDLAWAVESLDTLSEESIPNIMETFKFAKLIFCTVAKPNDIGAHYKNQQLPQYWISKFAENGFIFDLAATLAIRNTYSTMNAGLPDQEQYAKRNGLFFIRHDYLPL